MTGALSLELMVAAQGPSAHKPGQRRQSVNARGIKERRNKTNTHTHTKAALGMVGALRGFRAGVRWEVWSGACLRAGSQGLGSLALRGGLTPQGSCVGNWLLAPCISYQSPFLRLRGAELGAEVLGQVLEAARLSLGLMALAPCLRCPGSSSHQGEAGRFGNHSNNSLDLVTWRLVLQRWQAPRPQRCCECKGLWVSWEAAGLVVHTQGVETHSF